MDDVTLARGLHILAVVVWIGGVGFVTTVLLPAIRRLGRPEDRVAAFETMEHAFARQARGTTLLAGLSGFYMAYRLDLWPRFHDAAYWWMHAMVGVWLVFSLMLFVIEPLGLDRRLAARLHRDPEAALRSIHRLHWFLFGLSLVTIVGAVLGAHGALLFD